MKHVFISYVHDNAALVEKLCNSLKAAGVEVWRDRDEVKPGMRWELAIREAIVQGAYFIACFSREYQARSRSYMNEELTLAIEELRRRPTDHVWFIPVLLTEAEVPSRLIGGGEDLRSIQWVELYKDWQTGIQRILSVIEPSAVNRPSHFTNPIDGSSMELVPGGTYKRAKEDQVIIDTGPFGKINIPEFYISRHPITNAQYRLFLQRQSATFTAQPWFNARTTANGTGRDPPNGWVGGVGYKGALEYCKWAALRLPTMFEMEYFAIYCKSKGIGMDVGYAQKPFYWTSTTGRDLGGDSASPAAISEEFGTVVVRGAEDGSILDFGFRCAADADQLRNILRLRI